MRLLIDMNLSLRLAEQLRADGHDALHVREIGLRDASDAEIFAAALNDGRVIITCDLDFAKLNALAMDTRAGVLLVRLRNTRVDNVAPRLRNAIVNPGWTLQRGAMVTVDEDRYRVRAAPTDSGSGDDG